MDLWMTVKMGVKTLLSNKMRTFLTMLGIIIGVGSVIILLSITKGAENQIKQRINSLGSETIMIFASSTTKGGVRTGWGSINTLKDTDVTSILRNCSHVKYASPSIYYTTKVIKGGRNDSFTIQGYNEQFVDIFSLKLDKGISLSKGDVMSASKVCVIGKGIEDYFFTSDENAVGSTIRIANVPFRIVGVLESRGVGADSSDQDEVIYIPYTTMNQRVRKSDSLGMIMASATSEHDVNRAKEEITVILRERHKIREGGDDDFEIITQQEIAEMAQSFTRTMTLFLVAVASVSLLVGGIGIMNIMLVSVTERIREIGLRMAVGARRHDILTQFLIESVTLCLIGGLIGLGVGYVFANIIKNVAKMAVSITPFSIFLAMGFACVVGVFFGFYPAWKASKLNIIDALRHE